MGNLSKKDFILVSLMLFSLFFGAGNLIFPPFLGQSAGHQMWIAMLGFFYYRCWISCFRGDCSS